MTPARTIPLLATTASIANANLRGRVSAAERRHAWARHRQEMIGLILAKIDWIPVLVFVSLLLTPEARLDLGGFQLYPYRLAFFASLPFTALRVARRPIRLGFTDLLFISSACLMFLATAVHYTVDVAFKTGAANMLDMLLAYLTGRVYFRSTLDIRRFLYRVSPLLAGVAVMMALESITHQYIVRPFVSAVTGHSSAAFLAQIYEIRNGFLRATGPFMHPITAGLFFGTLAPLYATADLPKRRWWGLISCVGGIFGWSSAGIASILVGILLAVYQNLQPKLRTGWPVVVFTLVVMMVLVEALTESGIIRFIIRYGSLNPQTGYFRLAIWEYGSASVAKSPWFGIGFESYERPSWMKTASVDNYWLLHAMRYGIPGFALMFVGVIFAITRLSLAKRDGQLGAVHGHVLEVGLCISLSVTYFSLASVAPWGADLAWIIILTGAAVGLTDKSRGRVAT